MKKNITLSMDENLLKAGRKYAKIRHTTLNQLVRDLLEKTVMNQADKLWQEDLFRLADQAKPSSKGTKWSREDLYDV